MSKIIDFASAAARPGRTAIDKPAAIDSVLTPRPLQRLGKPDLPSPATETAKNARLREQRKCAWYAAEAATAYWRARMMLHGAISSAVRWRALPEGLLEICHPDFDDREDWNLLLRHYGTQSRSSF